jgi:hypothetical protein
MPVIYGEGQEVWSATVRLKGPFQITQSHHATYLPQGVSSRGSLFVNFL